MKADGVSKGRLFQQSLSPARLFEFEHNFFMLIKQVQSSTDLLDQAMDVRHPFGTLQSLQSGTISHPKNLQLPIKWINALNRWRTEANSQTGALHGWPRQMFTHLWNL
jgi:hypothetical protein